MDGCKVALVTGASGSGIGRSVALSLADLGFTVIVNYLKNAHSADVVVQHIRQRGGIARAIQCDVFDSHQCQQLVENILQTEQRIDVLFISPGASFHCEQLEQLKINEAINDILNEVTPVIALVPPVLKVMIEHQWGRIIAMGSNNQIPSPSYSYNVAKSSREEVLLRMTADAWKNRVTINVIAPGPVQPFASFEDALAPTPDHQLREITPTDIAALVSYLVSSQADFITGNTIHLRY